MTLIDFLSRIFFGMTVQEMERLFSIGRGGPPKKHEPAQEIDPNFLSSDDRFTWG